MEYDESYRRTLASFAVDESYRKAAKLHQERKGTPISIGTISRWVHECPDTRARVKQKRERHKVSDAVAMDAIGRLGVRKAAISLGVSESSLYKWRKMATVGDSGPSQRVFLSGELLSKAMAEAGLSESHLAEKADLPRNTIRYYLERVSSSARREYAERIAKALGKPVEEITSTRSQRTQRRRGRSSGKPRR